MEETNKKTKNRSLLVPILCIITISSVLFSALQTVYILRLASGSVGNMAYTRGQQEEQVVPDRDDTAPSVSPVANPEFSLERAASVTDPNKTTLSTVDIVTQVSPATVSVYVMTEVGGTTTPLYTGSGFFVSSDGYLVTNRHVIEEVLEGSNYSVLIVVPGYDVPVEAQVVGSDVQTDIAVLKAEEQDEPYAYVTLGDSDTLQVGELVVAIGNPLGRLSGTVTVGVVSALERQVNNDGYTMELIQTDASINSGNSGGPLINSFGEVVGITNAKMVVNDAEGLGFAITIDKVKDVIESLINYGVVVNRCYLGVTLGQVAEGSYYNAVPGVYVVEYVEDGPADKAGFRIGDRVISVNGVAIGKTDDIIEMRDRNNVGDTLHFVVDRNGEEIGIDLVIGDSADYQDNKTITDDSGRSGSKRGDSDDETDETEETNIFGGKK